MHMKTKFILLIFSLTLFLSCSDDDTKKPIIEVVTPTDGDHFHPGETISVRINFSDNEELASYKIEIHFNNDRHNHKNGSTTDTPFQYTTTGNFEKGLNRFELVHDIDIPALINELPVKNGEYHLGVYCIDKAGNQREVFVEIEIEQEV